MTDTEIDILKLLRGEAENASSLFSNKGQALQERTAVAGFLRLLGVNFRSDEIIKQGPEPIDVWFRDARFQVTEVLDAGRPRNLEIKNRLDRIRNAERLEDLVEPGTISSAPMHPDELVFLASKRAQEKSRKYGGDGSGIDLLIYVNLERRHLFPLGPFTGSDEAAFQGWRSVSVVMEGLAVVIATAATAPAFLVQHQGKARQWAGLDTVFPQLDGE
jgi:hypothetical protein